MSPSKPSFICGISLIYGHQRSGPNCFLHALCSFLHPPRSTVSRVEEQIPVLISWWWVALSASCKSEDKASLWGLQLNPQTTMFQIWFTGALMIPDRALSWCLNSMLTVPVWGGMSASGFPHQQEIWNIGSDPLEALLLIQSTKKEHVSVDPMQSTQCAFCFICFFFGGVGRGGEACPFKPQLLWCVDKPLSQPAESYFVIQSQLTCLLIQ